MRAARPAENVTLQRLSCRHDVAHGMRSGLRRPRDQDEQVGADYVGQPAAWQREHLTPRPIGPSAGSTAALAAAPWAPASVRFLYEETRRHSNTYDAEGEAAPQSEVPQAKNPTWRTAKPRANNTV
jgi:hypothetical protein